MVLYFAANRSQNVGPWRRHFASFITSIYVPSVVLELPFFQLLFLAFVIRSRQKFCDSLPIYKACIDQIINHFHVSYILGACTSWIRVGKRKLLYISHLTKTLVKCIYEAQVATFMVRAMLLIYERSCNNGELIEFMLIDKRCLSFVSSALIMNLVTTLFGLQLLVDAFLHVFFIHQYIEC